MPSSIMVRDAYWFLVPLVLLGLLFLWLDWFLLAGVSLALLLFVAFFFRDPERLPVSEADAILSPADGKLIRLKEEDEGIRLSIFLSIFNVHVNRAPVGGRVERCDYRPGRFHLAFDDRASVENEQLIYEIGGIRFALITGLVARRIVPWKKKGDSVNAGDRIALIRFGSRVDILIPKNAEILIQEGARVKGGLTVLARYSGAKS